MPIRKQFKASSSGSGSALFSRFDGLPDKDGDVTDPNAFALSRNEIPMSAYGHSSWVGALPPGKGLIRTDATGATFEFEFFNTTAGQDLRETVKGLGPLQEWSYGFDILDSEEIEVNGKPARLLKALDVYEVSPVLRGAGNMTQTLSVKGYGVSDMDTHNAFRIELERFMKSEVEDVRKTYFLDMRDNLARQREEDAVNDLKRIARLYL